MPKFQDLTGRKYGKLTVISRSVNGNNGCTRWLCLCECGKEHTVNAGHLKSGGVKDCGCEKSKRTTLRNTKHGDAGSRLYNIWIKMRDRCNNPNNADWNLYGGRGISICDEWNESYLSFKNWATSNGYSETLSIDRIDVNGGYNPSNCRWATNIEQCNNTRRNKHYPYRGREITIREASQISGLEYGTIKARLKYGWSMEQAINTPLDPNKWKTKHNKE